MSACLDDVMMKTGASDIKVVAVTFCHILSCLFESVFMFVMFLYEYMNPVLDMRVHKLVKLSYHVRTRPLLTTEVAHNA